MQSHFYKRQLVHGGFVLAICCSAVALAAHAVSNVEQLKQRKTVSYNDGSNECSSIILSPYADRETIAAALYDASRSVRVSGCVNITLDPAFPLDSHAADLEG